MRRIAVTALVFTLAAGCAGGNRSHSVQQHVQALLGRSDSVHFTLVLAWVFDSDAHAREAVADVPLVRWVGGSKSMTRVRAGNVIVVGSGTRGQLVRLGRALATLG